jgi:hypothetical protein
VARLAPRSGQRGLIAAATWLTAAAVACGSTPVVLSRGSIAVTFKTEETCGFENPYVADAKGCRVIDRKALMCEGFGVIDGVLFAGGCEAPVEARVVETRGTVPSAPAAIDAEDEPAAEAP